MPGEDTETHGRQLLAPLLTDDVKTGDANSHSSVRSDVNTLAIVNED